MLGFGTELCSLEVGESIHALKLETEGSDGQCQVLELETLVGLE